MEPLGEAYLFLPSRLFGLPFFLNGFQRFLFDIFPGISGLPHHSPLI